MFYPWRMEPEDPDGTEGSFVDMYNNLSQSDLDTCERIAMGPWGPHEVETFDAFLNWHLSPGRYDLANRVAEERWHRRANGRDGGFGGTDPMSRYFGAMNSLLFPGRGHDANLYTAEDFDAVYGLREYGYNHAWDELYHGGADFWGPFEDYW